MAANGDECSMVAGTGQAGYSFAEREVGSL